MKKPAYIDCVSLSEDDRIKAVGDAVMGKRMTVAFIVDDQGKADRYIAKLKRAYPGIVVIGRFPILGSEIAVKVGPPSGDLN